MTNPVTGVRVPKQSAEPTEMLPFTEAELQAAYERWVEVDARLADILLVLGWTGLRWAEARALTVADLMEVPTPGLLVRRSAPEGVGTKSTKGRRSRRVPLANRILPTVRGLAEGKEPSDLLLTTSRGARLHRSAVLRSLRWSTTGQGRRIHDLRHTAACLWLARGVDPGTVQAWMGHESIATTNRYLHLLGTGADSAGLERLNSRSGGTRGHRDAGRVSHNDETPPSSQRLRWRGGVLRWWSCGDSNPGPSHCEGVSDPIGHRSMRCMSCELTARVPRCRPRGARDVGPISRSPA